MWPQVYTVGPDYAHAEARKSPALDGKVERDSEGKEVRYPVMLSAMEKLVARKVCLAFKVSNGIVSINCWFCCISSWVKINVSCSPFIAANCVWLRSPACQWTLLCVWCQRFQFREELDEVLWRLCQDPRVPRLFFIIFLSSRPFPSAFSWFLVQICWFWFVSLRVSSGTSWCVSWLLSFRFPGPSRPRQRTSPLCPLHQGPCES